MPPRSYVSLTNTMTAPPAVGPWPGTTTQSNLDWEAQQQAQMQQALQGMNTLVSQAEAAQFARQQESQQAQAQYLAAVNGPANMAPPMSMALPYAAAQFSSALSGRPEVGQQADQSLALNRSMQLQRRGQLLEQLSQQTQEAARRAEAAGDLTNALKFNTKANSYLKEIEQAGTGLREARKTAIDQTFDAWRTMYNARADYLSRLVSAGAGQSDPKLAARLFALKEQHDTEAKALQEQIGTTPAKERGPLQARLDDINNRYTRLVEGALSGESIAPPVPEPAPPPTTAPAAAKPVRGFGVPRILGGPSRADFSAQVKTASDSLAAIPGFDPKEAQALLAQRTAGGERLGDQIARRLGVSYEALQTAARKRARPSRGGGGRY